MCFPVYSSVKCILAGRQGPKGVGWITVPAGFHKTSPALHLHDAAQAQSADPARIVPGNVQRKFFSC